MRIGIFGHYGNLNLGDEAIIEAAIESCRRFFPHCELALFSVNPADSSERHHLPAYPIRSSVRAATASSSTSAHEHTAPSSGRPRTVSRIKAALRRVPGARLVLRPLVAGAMLIRRVTTEARFVRQSHRRLRDFDLLIVAGSNQFLDNFGGPWGFPYTLLKWALLAKINNVRFVCMSVGAGPLDGFLSRAYVRMVVRLADYVSFRDAASRRLVEGNKKVFTGHVYPDLASNLSFPLRNRETAPDSRLAVGVNPMPMYDPRYWCETDVAKYDAYVEKMARFVTYLVEQRHDVFLFGTQQRDYGVAADILERMQTEARANVAVRVSTSVQELMQVIMDADIVVPTRFHGTVLAFVAQRCVLGVCYYRKAADLIDGMGQSEYRVLLDDFTLEDLIERFEKLANRTAAEATNIRTRSEEYRAEVDRQYALVAGAYTCDRPQDRAVADRALAAADERGREHGSRRILRRAGKTADQELRAGPTSADGR